MSGPVGWERYRQVLWADRDLGMSVDVSRMPDLDALTVPMAGAFAAMHDLEAGAIANPDENRQVGHYWLRDPARAPEESLTRAIRDTRTKIEEFAAGVHDGTIGPAPGKRFTDFLLIGIGGSALGPQFLADALATSGDRLRPHFIDNTDPDGIDAVLRGIGDRLSGTLVIVVSKSGGTAETRNGMLEVQAACDRAGLPFGARAVAVTGEGSALETLAREQGFLAVFPMWDWVGGRTSVTSAVGLLPAALQGIDIDAFLEGARAMDAVTRGDVFPGNPAALLAAAWHVAGNGAGTRDMVILPYKDRLVLFSRYLQQLVMESLGKTYDLSGAVVHQGLVVYGNKGSTDQHAYIQQLREGPDNFFATFIEVLRDREGPSPELAGGATAGDFLLGFLLGTRQALTEAGRASITITLDTVDPRRVGMLIALYERSVGLYASLIGINAYHQPGVEAGKRAANRVLALQERVLGVLRESPGRDWTVEALAGHLGAGEETETLHHILVHLAANPDHGIRASGGTTPGAARYASG